MNERWTERDERRMLFSLGAMSLSHLAKALNRSPRAIEERCKRHGRCLTLAIVNEHGMGTQAVAAALGTDRQRIERWIKLGWLHARRHVIKERYVLAVEHEALETFLRAIGGLLDGLRPDKEWAGLFEEASIELRARYIGRDELAAIFCFNRRTFSDPQWMRLHRFPSVVLRLQQRQCWHERAAVREWLRTAHPRYQTARTLRAFGLEENL